ncbi:hypothetical protein TrLO_g12007 [Triparma laevis f. longispina]|uniref:AP-4 complex subunit epsilon-1 C-terminal domain-containing protein n=1 Tax=Triparma laevis f. longispina TaxID=1714387 RepID=A0A9W7CH08_9STRA|nr:hypothetical protein TrLO_g12007 [Triparma laevis f. longispina]
MSGSHLSRDFFALVKAIGESKSKQEEDRIILGEIQTLKKILSGGKGSDNGSAGSAKKKAKEYLVRLMYVEMLGHDGSFGYIKAVELAAAQSIVHKRTGYLACGACLSPDHEFRFMLINRLQRDLASSNILEVCSALTAVVRLITTDMVATVVNDVTKLLSHQNDLVRKKSIIALHRLHQLDESNITSQDLTGHLRRILCDRDPSVMGASLCVIEKMTIKDAAPFKDLVPSLVSILKQVVEHRLPSEFDYHRVPAPWLQMKLVRILSLLGKGDKSSSEGMYAILADAVKRADTGINAGFAIVYEVVKAVTIIYPNTTLLDVAAEAISRFMDSSNHNLKYLGVTGLAMIVKDHPQYAAAHQLAVVECLDDPDETLQRKTLDLLFSMCNPVNCEFIATKLLSFLKDTSDEFLRKDLTKKIVVISERYAPNQQWYISTIITLFSIPGAGELVNPEIAQNLMSLLAEGGGDDDEEEDNAMRMAAVETFVNLLDEPQMPPILLQTLAWSLGEYAFLLEDIELSEIIEDLCKLARRTVIGESSRRYLVTAVFKLVSQLGTCPPCAAHLVDDYTKSRDPILQQSCIEFQSLITENVQLLTEVFPVDASCEDVGADENLSIVQGFVDQALAKGMNPYSPPDEADSDEEEDGAGQASKPVFNITPYEKPSAQPQQYQQQQAINPSFSSSTDTSGGASMSSGGAGGDGGVQLGGGGDVGLRLSGVANVWGPNMEVKKQEPVVVEKKPEPVMQPMVEDIPAPVAASAFVAVEEQKAKELTDKEKMAMALFGGLGGGGGGGGGAKERRGSTGKSKLEAMREKKAAAAAGTVPGSAPVPVPTPAPAPSDAGMDLLDMTFDGPTEVVVASPPTAVLGFDGGGDLLSPAPSSAPAPTPVAGNNDPFGVLNEPASLEAFSYESVNVVPLPIDTAGFGSRWGQCGFQKKASVKTPNRINSLDDIPAVLPGFGFHPVETIVKTSEAIAAGVVGGDGLILLHFKVKGGGLGVDVTVKANNPTIGEKCFEYMLESM